MRAEQLNAQNAQHGALCYVKGKEETEAGSHHIK